MNKKLIWLFLPVIILPYYTLASIYCMMWSSRNALAEWIFANIFGNNPFIMMLTWGALAAVAFICCLIYSGFTALKGWDPLFAAKTAMIVKLILIPAYLILFVEGMIFMITIFTAFFALIIFITDCCMLFATSGVNAASAVSAVKKKLFTEKEVLPYVLCQFIFCLDVIFAVAYYKKLKELFKS